MKKKTGSGICFSGSRFIFVIKLFFQTTLMEARFAVFTLQPEQPFAR